MYSSLNNRLNVMRQEVVSSGGIGAILGDIDGDIVTDGDKFLSIQSSMLSLID